MKITRGKAIKATEALDLEQFPEIPCKYRVMVRALLMVIAKHYPNSMPGQETIARELCRSVRVVQRYLAMAVAAGLVEVTSDSGMGGRHGHWRTNTYRLWYLHRTTRASSRPDDVDGGQTPTYYVGRKEEVKKKTSSSSSLQDLETAIPAELLKGEPIAVPNRWSDDDPAKWEEPAYGEDHDAPLEGKVVSIDPAVRLSRVFEKKWISVVLKRHRDYRGTRIIDTGPAVVLIRDRMLNHLSPDYIEAYMTAFMESVRDDLVEIKPGQSAWERFWHWWGRGVEVEDPAIRREKEREDREMQEQYLRFLAAKEKSQGAS